MQGELGMHRYMLIYIEIKLIVIINRIRRLLATLFMDKYELKIWNNEKKMVTVSVKMTKIYRYI